MELMHRILVSSAKGGIGKSTTALGLAAALASRGRRVLLADCDVGNRCLDLMLGLEDCVLSDIGDVAAGRCAPDAALIPVPGMDSLRFCAAPNVWPEGCPLSRLPEALGELAEAAGAEFVICDSAGVGDAVRAVVSDFADGVLILSTQQPASIRSAERTASAFWELKQIPSRLIISCFDTRAARRQTRAGLLEIIDRTHLRTIGVVPYDGALLLAQENGRPVGAAPMADAAHGNIARRLLGEDVRLFEGMGRLRAQRLL